VGLQARGREVEEDLVLIFGLAAPKVVSACGLAIELIGFLLIWKYGLPRSMPKVHYIVESFGEYKAGEMDRIENLYNKIAHVGLACVVGGVLIQVFSCFI
jgi:hypothetical protein